MVQFHRAETVLPARSLGETYRDESGQALKVQPERRCLHCPTMLSRYNDEDLCGVCRQNLFQKVNSAITEARQDSRPPRERFAVAVHRVCRMCKSSFTTYSKRRRCCYSCISSKI